MRAWVLPIVFLLLFIPLVTAQSGAAGAFIKAMGSGEYSYLEPYLSPQMQSAFSESKFVELRSSLVEKYGGLVNASYTGAEGGYEYVRVNFERASVSFKLIIQGGKVAGLWIVGVSKRHEKALTPQDAMMGALKTGNYSIVEPYLSPIMKKALTRGSFEAICKSLIGAHGEIQSYEFVKREEEGPYITYYYRVTASKGTYTVTVTVRDGKVDGFHLKGVPFKATASALYPILGALLAFLIIWAYVRKLGVAEVIFGMVLLFIVLLIQPLIQSIPTFLGVSNITFLVLWTGFIAGLLQEVAKYYASRGKSQGKALYIGVGFGFGEAIYVSLISMVSGGSVVVLSALERFLALLFHASTTVIFSRAYGQGKGREALTALILIHWFVDSLAAYWHYSPSYIILGVSYAVMLAVGLYLIKLLPGVKAGEETETIKW